MDRKVRVRFAPSPTGPLHIGGMRTALYNYLFARKNGGVFVLRIEDTDQTRIVDGAEDYIHESLKWCGLIPDESPWAGGAFASYRQSERKEIYAGFALQLLESESAYYAFDTVDELDRMRKKYEESGRTFQYDSSTRMGMKNSLTLPLEETESLKTQGTPFVVRLKVPEQETVVFNDLIRGEVEIHTREMDDKILLKSDGMPTYHLANVVDDHMMEISHVIRGEEWLPSAPLHVLLYRYLGWETEMPRFAHLPLLLKPDGKGKLSKRDGLKLGIPVFPLDWTDPGTGEKLTGFRESGYLPDALVNFLSLLGWNPGTEQEIFSLNELVRSFSIERIGKAGAKFDIEKAQWFNQQYLKGKPTVFLAGHLEYSLQKENISSSKDKIERVAEAMRERITFPNEIWGNGKYFFLAPVEYDEKVIRKKWNSEVAHLLGEFAKSLEKHGSVTPEQAKETLSAVLEFNNTGMGKVMQALRVALTGDAGGPDLMTVISIIGPQESSKRIMKAIEVLRNG